MIDGILRNSKNIAFYSLVGYFFSTTFSHFLAQISYASALLFAIIAFLSDRGGCHKFRLSAFYIMIISFVGWSILSALFGPTPVASLLILKEEWLFLMIPTVAFVADSENKIEILIKTLAISALLIAIFGIIQHYIAPLVYHGGSLSQDQSGHYRSSGGFSHYLTFGDYFAIAATFLFGVASYLRERKWRVITYLAALLTALATIFTYSYGPILSLVMGLVFYVIFFGKRNILIASTAIVVIAIVAILFAPKIQSKLKHTIEVEWTGKYEGSRLAIWRASERMIRAHPVFGLGQGNYDNQYLEYSDPGSTRKFSHAHNDILNVAAYAGIPAAIFFLGFWCIIIFRMVKGFRRERIKELMRGIAVAVFLGSLVFFVTSQYEASFADEEVRLFLMAMWGLFLGAESIIKSTPEMAENIEKA